MDYQHNLGPFWLISAIIVIIPFWRICRRIGWSPWLSLLWAIPVAGVILLYVMAFSDWPSQKATVVSGGT
jgi:uncharacterized membrane protein